MTVTYTNFNGRVVHENRGGVERGYVHDPQGNTVALVDSTGAVTDTWEYSPFGEVESHTGSSPTPFTFCGTLGYYKDPGALTYVRARYYNAQNGQWQTMDPLHPFDFPYHYGNLNPISYVDYSGMAASCSLPQRPCSDILKDVKLDKAGEELLKCLAKAGNDTDSIQKCFDAYLGAAGDAAKDKLIEYLGCLAGSNVASGPKNDLDPCRPQNDDYCQECCYSKFITCLLKCYKKKGSSWALCLRGCQSGRRGFESCLLDCP